MCLFSVRTNVRISARKVGEDSEDARSQWGRNHWCPGPDLLFFTILFPLCFLCHSSLPWVNGVNSLNAPSCLREENEWVAGFINANIGLLEQLSLQQEKYISRYSAICTLYLCVYDAMMHTVSHFFFFCFRETASKRISQMDPDVCSCPFLKLQTWFTWVTFNRITILLSCSLRLSNLLSKGLCYKFCWVL